MGVCVFMCIIVLPITSARAPSTTTSTMATGAISTLVAAETNRQRERERGREMNKCSF